MLWLIEKAILCKKLKSYYTKRNIFSILVIVIIESIAAIQTIKEKQARVAAHYNFSKCKKQVSDSFEAYIYSISKSNQTIKFKSADSTRTDFTYSFPTPQEEIAKSI